MRLKRARLGRVDLGACVALGAMTLAVATLFAQPTPGAGDGTCVASANCPHRQCPNDTVACCCKVINVQSYGCFCLDAGDCLDQRSWPQGWTCSETFEE